MSNDVDYWQPEKDLVEAMSPRLGAIVRYVDAVRVRAERNAEMVLDEAAVTVDVDVEELLRRVGESEELMMLLAMTVEAAQRAASEHRVHAIGRAFALGVLQHDDAAIDESEMLVSTLRDLSAPHIQALDAIAALGEPDEPYGLQQSDRLPWVSVRHDVYHLLADDFGRLTAPILATLVRHGLVRAHEASSLRASGPMQSHYATAFGHRLIDMLYERANEDDRD